MRPMLNRETLAKIYRSRTTEELIVSLRNLVGEAQNLASRNEIGADVRAITELSVEMIFAATKGSLVDWYRNLSDVLIDEVDKRYYQGLLTLEDVAAIANFAQKLNQNIEGIERASLGFDEVPWDQPLEDPDMSL